jgi:DNA-binding MarR family transcriptional regulator
LPRETGAGDAVRWEDLDRVVHEPARLVILVQLAFVEEADFLYLLRQTGLTKGNLSSHLARLEEVGYVTIAKDFVGKVPRTRLALTPSGRTAYTRYRAQLAELLANHPA